MITSFATVCVMFWLWRLCRRWDRQTPPTSDIQPECPLPVRRPLGPLPFIPFGKTLDIPPVIK